MPPKGEGDYFLSICKWFSSELKKEIGLEYDHERLCYGGVESVYDDRGKSIGLISTLPNCDGLEVMLESQKYKERVTGIAERFRERFNREVRIV